MIRHDMYSSRSEMIDELKSVLVPDDEIARIRQYNQIMEDMRAQREKSRQELLSKIGGKSRLNSR